MFFFTFIFDTLAFNTTNIVKRASAELFCKPNFFLFVVSLFFLYYSASNNNLLDLIHVCMPRRHFDCTKVYRECCIF